MDIGTMAATKENYDVLRWGFCCVCHDKIKAVDDYDICEDCNETRTADSVTRLHIFQLFDLLHKEEIASYEYSIHEAYNENDADGLRIVAEELKDLCFSYGFGGQVYIEDRVHKLRKTRYDKGTQGHVLTEAFDWWHLSLQPMEADYSFPPKNIYKSFQL